MAERTKEDWADAGRRAKAALMILLASMSTEERAGALKVAAFFKQWFMDAGHKNLSRNLIAAVPGDPEQE